MYIKAHLSTIFRVSIIKRLFEEAENLSLKKYEEMGGNV